MSTDDLALRLVALKVLTSILVDEDTATRAELRAAMKVGARAIAELPDGTTVGAVTYSRGNAGKPVVDDEEAFTAWVQAKYPGEVVTIPERVIPATTEVRPAFRAALLKDIAKTGDLPDGVIVGADGAPKLTVPALPPGAIEALVAEFRADGIGSLLSITATKEN